MRIDRLIIPAYGPFTDLELELPDRRADFHLIYGPNEAGKSCLLQAIGDWLYGIPAQSRSNFLHDYGTLRISGVLRRADGSALAFQRRKGNKNTLLDESGEVIGDSILDDFLGTLDREYFQTMFGLGSCELRDGSEAILEGEGELGQSLFSASLAGTPVHRILAALDEEADALFSGRKSKVLVRLEANAFRDCVRQSRESLIPPEAWEETLRGLADATARKQDLEGRLRNRRERLDWIQRCLDALPALSGLAEKEAALAALPLPPNVPDGFVEIAAAARTGAAAASKALSEQEDAVSRLEDRVASTLPDAKLLTREDEIEVCHQKAGLHRQASEALVRVESRIRSAESELRSRMKALALPDGKLESIESLRMSHSDQLAFQSSAKALVRTQEQLERHQTRKADAEQAREGARRKLAAAAEVEVSALQRTLHKHSGDVESAKALPALGREQAAAAAALGRAHKGLTGAPQDPAAAFEMKVPTSAAIQRFLAERQQLSMQEEAARGALAKAGERARDARKQLGRLERNGALPTLDDLQQAREDRDKTWTLVVGAWKEGAKERPVDGRPLVEAYPLAVTRADGLADRLREEAGQVSQAEELRSQIETAEEDRAAAEGELRQIGTQLKDWQNRWKKAWQPAGLDPGTPEEMSEWRDQWLAFRQKYEKWLGPEEAIRKARAAVTAAEREFRAVLDPKAHGDVVFMAQRAQEIIQLATRSQGARQQMESTLQELEGELDLLNKQDKQFAEAERSASKAWAEACRKAGLKTGMAPDAAVSLLSARGELVMKHDDWIELREERERLRGEIAAYEEDVRLLAGSLGLGSGPTVVLESRLWDMLQSARGLRVRHREAERELAEKRRLGARLKTEAARADAGWAKVLKAAKVSDPEGLEAVLRLLRTRAELGQAIGHLRDTLLLAARGEALDEFIGRVRREDAGSLVGEKGATESEIGDLGSGREDVIRELKRHEDEKKRMEEAGAGASDLLQEAKNHAARLRQAAARHIRLRLAAALLRRQVEEFRKSSQAPMLRRASEIFAEITLGSFAGLAADVTEDDTPVLVGRRNGSKVTVEGMSDGTRDQLYLALRLAAIERHLEQHEPMPLLLDDLLVNFDDARAKAILRVLAGFSRRIQVLLFTHHQHLAAIARKTLPKDSAEYHCLLVPAISGK